MRGKNNIESVAQMLKRNSVLLNYVDEMLDYPEQAEKAQLLLRSVRFRNRGVTKSVLELILNDYLIDYYEFCPEGSELKRMVENLLCFLDSQSSYI
jgi:hypothetical protein